MIKWRMIDIKRIMICSSIWMPCYKQNSGKDEENVDNKFCEYKDLKLLKLLFY